MSTTELNTFLSSFDRPEHYSNLAWNEVIRQARQVWLHYLAGKDWNQQLDITCKESYLMLVNDEGKLIVNDETLLNYVKNDHVSSWKQRLEEIAFKAIRDKRYDKAERYFTKALKVDSSNAMNHYRRALVRIKLFNHKGALVDLSEAIALKPDFDTFYLKRAQVYRLLDIDHKAMSDLNKAIKLNPSSSEAFDMRGKFRLSLGDRTGARIDLNKAEELRSNGRIGQSEVYGAQAA